MTKYAKLILQVPPMEDPFQKAVDMLLNNGYELTYLSNFCANIANKEHNIEFIHTPDAFMLYVPKTITIEHLLFICNCFNSFNDRNPIVDSVLNIVVKNLFISMRMVIEDKNNLFISEFKEKLLSNNGIVFLKYIHFGGDEETLPVSLDVNDNTLSIVLNAGNDNFFMDKNKAFKVKHAFLQLQDTVSSDIFNKFICSVFINLFLYNGTILK